MELPYHLRVWEHPPPPQRLLSHIAVSWHVTVVCQPGHIAVYLCIYNSQVTLFTLPVIS